MNHLLFCILATWTFGTARLSQASDVPPEARFQQARSLGDDGRWNEALAHYDRLLVENWNRDLVSLEKAFALEKIGHSEEAALLYENVLAQNPPPEVRANIEGRLSSISNSRGTSSSRNRPFSDFDRYNSASLGYFYDSNVNAGPATDTLFIFNLPFVLSVDAMQTSAHGYQFQFNTGAAKALNRGRAIQASFGYNRIDYEGIELFDFDSLQGRVEYLFPFAKGTVGIPLGYGAYFLNDRFYSQSISTGPSYRFRMSNKLESITSNYLAYNSNGQISQRTGLSTALSQRFRWSRPDGRRFVEVTGSYGHEFAEAKFLSSHQARFGVAGFTELPHGFNLYVAPGFQYVQYDAADPLFGVVRQEPELTLNVNLGHPVGFLGLDCALGYTFTQSFANLGLYEFARHQASFTLHKEF